MAKEPKKLEDLFHDTLKDIYYAEKKILGALPKMAKAAQNEDLKAAFAQAKRPAVVDLYQANHGWCVKGGQAYNEAEAERAWTALSQLYKTSLA